MAIEAVLYLTQAGLVSTDRPLWDSSHLLAETSVLGQLAYALVGYEATPTGLQLGAYFATVAAILTAMAIAYRRRQHSHP
jgi:high-affinity iron transporter